MAEAVKIMEPAKKADAPVPVKLEKPMDLATRMREVFDNISKRAFEIFEHNGRALGREWDDWFRAESEVLRPVFLNVQESDKEVTVKAEVPGFTSKDLQVSVEGTRLTITGKRETKEEKTDKKTVYREHSSDQIMRIIDLPAAVDAEKATATLKNGMSDLFQRLAQLIREHGQIEQSATIERIELLEQGGFRLHQAAGVFADFDRVLIASPAFRAARLLSTLVSCIRYSRLVSAVEPVAAG